MTSTLEALGASVQHLRDLVAALDDDGLARSAYAEEWTIADVLSHVGSGAVIQQRRLDAALADRPTPDDFAPAVWDEWNAKSHRAKADDAQRADRELLRRLEAMSDAERDNFALAMGPISLDFAGFVGLRLNEHALHTWDIEVALDPEAGLRPDAVELVVDNLMLIARYTARPTGSARAITVRTTDPERWFTIDLAADQVTVHDDDQGREAEITLPAEAFVRLVYGRLDAEHTPAFDGDADLLGELRRVFPGP
jgi:uncharacterized protein (TIGR03083 family)